MNSKNSSSNIRVFCRFRPFNQKELQEKSERIHRISNHKQLIIRDPAKSDEMSFMYDHIFETDSTQEQVYQEVGMPVLNNILDGFNGTIMAYGQTSSGKTHTMQGYDLNDREAKGIIPRIIENLFHSIEKSADNMEFKLKVSIFEIYMEKVRDLLDVSKSDLKIRENKAGPYVEHLTQAYISDRLEFYKLIQIGQKNRITCVTNMNAHSSRSHMIFLLTLSQTNLDTSQSKSSKLFLIDLAGSEKISKTGAEGMVLEQAKKINLSLTSLGKVIKSLSERIQHVPYRQSKLTRVIKDSLGGNSKTTLIVTCSPHEIHIPQTISTLRFGENAQKIKNKPKINRELTVEELQKMIEKLEASIEEKDAWIDTLEKYIKNQLNAELPKKSVKLKIQQQCVNEASQKQTMAGEEESRRSSKDIESLLQQQTILMDPTLKAALEEQIANLQAELGEYKKNLQSQVNKVQFLKKQYASLNENIKNLIEENIAYQQKEKQNEESMSNIEDKVLQKYRKNCALVFGEILDKCADCTGPESCYGGIKDIVDEKAKCLCYDDENISSLDFWRKEKQILTQEIYNKLRSQMAKELKPDEQSSKDLHEQEMREQAENQRIIEAQEKLDILYHQYQEMLALQTNWKVECQLYERKLKIKQQKITQLRTMLQQIQQKMELFNDDYEDTVSVRSKIVKPIKGGFLFK